MRMQRHRVPKDHPDPSESGRVTTESGKTSVFRQRWVQEGKRPVTLYTVTNGGHVIPNPTTRALLLGRTTRDIDGADAVAELIAETATEVECTTRSAPRTE